MNKIIELTRAIETNTIAYGNAVGIVDKEHFANIVNVLRSELTFAIKKNERK